MKTRTVEILVVIAAILMTVAGFITDQFIAYKLLATAAVTALMAIAVALKERKA